MTHRYIPGMGEVHIHPSLIPGKTIIEIDDDVYVANHSDLGWLATELLATMAEQRPQPVTGQPGEPRRTVRLQPDDWMIITCLLADKANGADGGDELSRLVGRTIYDRILEQLKG